MKDIKEILDEFVKECSEKLELEGIVQFGSSTYSKNPSDIDLVLISNKDIIPARDILTLINTIKNFERKYPEVVFDFGGINTRKKEGEYSITSVFIGKKDLSIKYNLQELVSFKMISEEENTKILYGKNPFKEINIKLTKEHLFEMISSDIKRYILRQSLDDKEKLDKGLYDCFKGILRYMLIDKGNFKKEELLKEFKKEYKNEIYLPKNSKDILNHEIKKEDFEDILKFSEDCLKYLSK